MKVLMIAGRIPSENTKGDQLVSFNRVKYYLSQNFDIKIICYGNEQNESDYSYCKKLRDMGAEIELIKINRIEALINLCISFKSKLPFQCAIYQSSAFKKEIQQSINSFTPSFLHFITIRYYVNKPKTSLPVFIDMIDSMALNFSRRIKNSKGLMRLILAEEYDRLLNYEKKAANSASHSFVVSAIDKDFIQSSKVTSLPNGVDTKKFRPNKNFKKNLSIVFTGNMSYQPNIDAVMWFVDNCYKGIKKEFPNINFNIVGNNPHNTIVKLSTNDKSIKVLGRVDSIADNLNNSICSIAPMRLGAGMQNKILEAMACGIPVVCSTMGLGDIKAIKDRDILVYDSPSDFTHGVIGLLKSKELQERIGESGLQYVMQNHNWKSVNENFFNLCLKNLKVLV